MRVAPSGTGFAVVVRWATPDRRQARQDRALPGLDDRPLVGPPIADHRPERLRLRLRRASFGLAARTDGAHAGRVARVRRQRHGVRRVRPPCPTLAPAATLHDPDDDAAIRSIRRRRAAHASWSRGRRAPPSPTTRASPPALASIALPYDDAAGISARAPRVGRARSRCARARTRRAQLRAVACGRLSRTAARARYSLDVRDVSACVVQASSSAR